MILVDTSVWIDHIRRRDPELTELLNAGKVLAHPFVIGELALGSIRDSNHLLREMKNLPAIVVARDDEVLRLITNNALGGSGIGYVDAHLLAAVRLTPGSALWTRDRRLAVASDRLSLAH
jgi:predicted nucleic acid-binding protein